MCRPGRNDYGVTDRVSSNVFTSPAGFFCLHAGWSVSLQVQSNLSMLQDLVAQANGLSRQLNGTARSSGQGW